LRIDPCILKKWKEFSVNRRFRGITYNIKFKNPGGIVRGVKKIWIYGKEIEGNLLPVVEHSDVCNVEVLMG
jgi:cellobiose phosphorylase